MDPLSLPPTHPRLLSASSAEPHTLHALPHPALVSNSVSQPEFSDLIAHSTSGYAHPSRSAQQKAMPEPAIMPQPNVSKRLTSVRLDASTFAPSIAELPIRAQAKIFDAFPPAGQAAFYRRYRLNANEQCDDRDVSIQARLALLTKAQSPAGFVFMRTDPAVRKALVAIGFEKTTRKFDAAEKQNFQPFSKNMALFLAREIQLGTFDGEKLGEVMVGLIGRLPNLSQAERRRIFTICIERLPQVPPATHDKVYAFFHNHRHVHSSAHHVPQLAQSIPKLRGIKRCDTDHRIQALGELHNSPELDHDGMKVLYTTFRHVHAASRSANKNAGIGSPLLQQVAFALGVDGRAKTQDRLLFLTETVHVFPAELQLPVISEWLRDPPASAAQPLAT